MREIKFRAYDIKEKKWLWPYPEGFSLIGEVTVFGMLDQWKTERFIERLNDLKIVQYTGLKDKNGKEIFEGDIIDYIGHGLTVVEYTENMFHLKSLRYVNLSTGNYRLATLHYRFEIIGNIYDNPELLENN